MQWPARLEISAGAFWNLGNVFGLGVVDPLISPLRCPVDNSLFLIDSSEELVDTRYRKGHGYSMRFDTAWNGEQGLE